MATRSELAQREIDKEIELLYLRRDLLQDEYDITPIWGWAKRIRILERVKQIDMCIKDLEHD